MNQTFQLSFDIQCGADPSDLLDRLIEFQQHLVDDLEQEDDVFGEPMPNRGNENTCSVGTRPLEGGDDLEQNRIETVKNNLLHYLLEAVDGNFEHLTDNEQSIVGDQETFNQLLKSFGGKS